MTFDANTEFAELARMKREAKRLKEEADAAQRAMKEREAQLWQRADEAGTRGHRSSDGTRAELKETFFGTITDYELFKDWVVEHDLSEELLKTSEESARLNELVRERLETSQELPPGVGWYARRYVSITHPKENA